MLYNKVNLDNFLITMHNKSPTTPRCTELNERDTEAKESVSSLYCQSGSSEQLFRKKAWLEKMEKEIPHSKATHRLKCHVLQESGTHTHCVCVQCLLMYNVHALCNMCNT